MSTYMQNPKEVERKWHIIDAKGKSLGRVAALAATLLIGKHKVTYTPHVDCGDHVIIINCAEVVLTGNKLQNKYYHKFTGYIGNLKSVRYDTLMKTKPEKAMELAIKRMLPKNRVSKAYFGRLRAVAGSNHKHAAQQPVAWKTV